MLLREGFSFTLRSVSKTVTDNPPSWQFVKGHVGKSCMLYERQVKLTRNHSKTSVGNHVYVKVS